MLVGHSDRCSPARLNGAAVVAGLHGVVLSIALAIDSERAPAPAARAVEVRLIDAPSRRDAEPALPTLVSALQPPAPLDLPPLPDVAIEERPAPAIAHLKATSVAGAPPATGDAGAPVAQRADATTAPAHVQHVEYARFEPPVYPPLSRRLGEQGLVVVRVQIDETGRPVEVTVSVSSGFPRLDEAAIAAVRRARFVPHSEGGRARPAYALVPIRFDLS
jgi:protein TonB